MSTKSFFFTLLLLLLYCNKPVYCDDNELEEEIEKQMHPDPLDVSVTDAIIIRNVIAKQAEDDVENHNQPKYAHFLHEDALKLKEIKEADLMLDNKDLEMIKENINPTKDEKVTKRGMIPFARKLWIDRDIPYDIDHSGTSRKNANQARAAIEKAMNDISSKSCIKFRPKRSGDRNWLRFFRGSGCYSGIGRKYWEIKPTEVSLSEGCFAHSIVVHEIYHALGFFHEQSRPDRDSFVRIDFSKVNPSMKSNFDKHQSYETNVQETPYDYMSIMHYGKKAFSIDGSQTIFPKFDENQQLGGDELRPSDVKELNEMYDCHRKTDDHSWSSWSTWSPCFKDWRHGCSSVTNRFCLVFNTDRSKCPEADEFGVEENRKKCESYLCDETFVHPNWGSWGEWDTCSRECGEGSFKKERVCNNPPPRADLNVTCIGAATKTSLCRLKRCNPERYPFDGDFEKGFEPWKDDSESSIHWQINRGPSPSKFSGPKESFLTAQYAVLTTKGDWENNDIGRLISPEIPAKNGMVCVSFYYQMNGKAIKYLDVFIKTKSGKSITYWMMNGHQGAEWKTGAFTIPLVEEPYHIIVEGKTGTNPYTDIAVDDIRIDNGSCIKGTEGCKDHYDYCAFWKYLGYCYKSFDWMLKACCKTCSGMAKCENRYDITKNVNKCVEWAGKNECMENRMWMWKECCHACRECADSRRSCKEWAEEGWCEKSDWMMENCKTSCNVCKA